MTTLKRGEKLAADSFGFAGVDHWRELAGSNELGVVRYVNKDSQSEDTYAGVRYAFAGTMKPPSNVPRWRSTDDPNRWELPIQKYCNSREFAHRQSLEKICRELHKLHRSRGKVKPDHPRLAKLDAAFEQVLAVAENLHRRQQLLGLLTPENIIIVGEKHRALMPDVGFRKASTPAPPWIKRVDKKWGELWNPEPADAFYRGEWSSDAEAKDVAMVARLAYWCLMGELHDCEHAVVKHVEERFAAEAKAGQSAALARCWITILRAIAPLDELRRQGQEPLRTMQELRAALAQNRLSEHFHGRPRKPVKIPWLTITTVVAAVALVVAGVLYIPSNIDKFFPSIPGPSHLCKDCQYPSKLLPGLKEMEELMGRFRDTTDPWKTRPSAATGEQLMRAITDAKEIHKRLADLEGLRHPEGHRSRGAEDACLTKLRQEVHGRIGWGIVALTESHGRGVVPPRDTEIAQELNKLWKSGENEEPGDDSPPSEVLESSRGLLEMIGS